MDGRAGLAGVLLPLLLITWVIPAVSQNSDPAGWSIDCGSNENYTDDRGIYWVTDHGFTHTGKNTGNLFVQSQSTIVNENQSTSLRYFDKGRGRDCYVLPVIPQNTYLIRPTFYYGDWDNPANVTAFDVYLSANLWINFHFDQDTLKDFTYTFEALVYMTNDHLDFCLVRRAGIPFISSLELRQLESGMYTGITADHQFMGMSNRYNSGGDLNGLPYLRYPDDVYDRIWYTPPGSFDNATHIKSTAKVRTSPNLTPERPPEKVMEDAWVYYNSDGHLYYLVPYSQPVGAVAIYSYFQEVDGNASASNMRGMDYYVNGVRIDNFTLDVKDPYEVKSCVLTVYDTFINISVFNTSKLTPILNAFEIYFVFSWDGTVTFEDDVNSIQGIKKQLNLTDWIGDPCVPEPYDWLDCSRISDNQASPSTESNNQTSAVVNPDRVAYVTGMSLANMTIQTIPEEIGSLSLLQSLNLSNTSLARIPSNGLSTPQNLTVLDLSNNRFSGDVLSFVQSIKVKSLQKLYAGNNSLEGEFPLQQLYAEFPNLQEARFDENPNITGILDLTSWQTALKSSANIAVVKAASSPTRATPAPAPAPAPTTTLASTVPLVSLTNNRIAGIIPSLDELSSDINKYLQNTGSASFHNHGILLGGNPWCLEKAFIDQPLSQQYLCRSYSNEVLPGLDSLYSQKNTNNLGAIIGGVLGGIAFLVACVLLAAVWRFCKQTSSLKEVQEELARQKVKPPFYLYSDLRTATNDFSPENKLGQGTFGDVYRGIISNGKDGTLELLAVKRLYPSKQALPEFLNETVLITGIKHRNLVQLKGCCIHKEDQRMLVYEYAENGNLAEALWGEESSAENRGEPGIKTTLDWHQRLNICEGIARGLSYLHEELQPRIIHRDIKPYNILLDKNYKAKIADFGLARSMLEGEAEVDFTKVAGTKGYFAPEYATQGQLTEKADVFSFGVVLLEIVSGRKCIDLSLPGEQQFLQALARHLKEAGKLLDLLDPAIRETADNAEVIRVINLAFLCLEFYPERRPIMSHAVAMLQGIMDVTLHSHESDSQSHAYRPSDPYNYMKLPLSLGGNMSEEHPSDSLEISATSSNNNGLELSKLSGR